MGRQVDTRLGSPFERFTRMMFARIIAGVARTLRDEELSVAQLAAISLVDQAGSLRISELAEALQRSVSAASRLVDALVERQLLSRTEDPDDRRARRLQLTVEGKAFMDQASRERVALFDQTIVRHVPTSVARIMVGIITRIVG